MVEHFLYTEGVAGSNPAWSTREASMARGAVVARSHDAGVVAGSIPAGPTMLLWVNGEPRACKARTCRFESGQQLHIDH